MTRYLFAAGVLFSVSCNPKITVTKVNFPGTAASQGQIYLLPKKVLKLSVAINMFRYETDQDKHGPVAARGSAALGFLGIEEEDRYLIQVASLTMEEKVVPDYSQAYLITADKMSNNFIKDTELKLGLAEGGILKSVSTSSTSNLSSITSGLATTAKMFINTLMPIPITKAASFGYLSPSGIEKTSITKVDTIAMNRQFTYWLEVRPGQPAEIRVDEFLRGDNAKVRVKLEFEGGLSEPQKSTPVADNAIVYRTPVVRLTKALLEDDQDYPLVLVAKRYGYNTSRVGMLKELASLYVSYPQLGPLTAIPLSFKKNGTVNINFMDGTFDLSTVDFNATTVKEGDFTNYQNAINELNAQLEQMRKKQESEKNEE
jgi:hypothetical protein